MPWHAASGMPCPGHVRLPGIGRHLGFRQRQPLRSGRTAQAGRRRPGCLRLDPRSRARRPLTTRHRPPARHHGRDMGWPIDRPPGMLERDGMTLPRILDSPARRYCRQAWFRGARPRPPVRFRQSHSNHERFAADDVRTRWFAMPGILAILGSHARLRRRQGGDSRGDRSGQAPLEPGRHPRLRPGMDRDRPE